MSSELQQAIDGIREALAASETVDHSNPLNLELALGRLQGAADNLLDAAK
ncbi:hypothetical protein [Streptomyces sp. SID2119]|nr:hypothetical protein [Streptomyces sp. SID2119]MYW33600.1 hypothetical protein [Streptomyces sp. SID2119]